MSLSVASGASMRPSELLRRRLDNQWIASPRAATPGELAAWMVALQAQDYPGGKWSIGLRLRGVTDDDVERAIETRQIVRSWPFRGTLHFVAAADLRWLLDLGAARVIATTARRLRELGIEARDVTRSQRAFRSALRGGGAVTRDEANALMRGAGVATDGQRSFHLLNRAALDGVLCFGVRRGKQQTFVLLDEWIPESRRLPRPAALGELALRYFRSRGPATVQDFQWWSGLPAADSRAGLEHARRDLVEVTFDERPHFLVPDGKPGGAAAGVHLLPGFDEYLIAYKDRGAALAPEHTRFVNSGGGMLYPALVSRGRVAGTWKRTLARSTVNVVSAPFAPLTSTETRAAAACSRRFAEFLGLQSIFE